MSGGTTNPACELCEGTEYVQRDGFFYCIFCETQSQEKGQVQEIDEGIFEGNKVTTKSTRKGEEENKQIKLTEEEKFKYTQPVRWHMAEGYALILNDWCKQLEKLGVTGVRENVLEVYALYLQKNKVCFTKTVDDPPDMKEDQREVPTMHYRDRWYAMGGPDKVTSNAFLSLLIIGKEVRAKQQEEKKERAAEISQDDLDDLEKNKKNSTARRRYLKYLSKTLDEEEIMETESKKDEFIDAAGTLHEFAKTLSRKTKDDGRHKFFLRNIRGVFVLAVTGMPNSVVTTSDLAHLFSSDYLPWTNSIKVIPKNFKPCNEDIFALSGNLHVEGLQIVKEFTLSEEAKEIAQLIHIQDPPIRLTVCTPLSFHVILERYIKDMCLPRCLITDIMRTFSGINLMTLVAKQTKKSRFKSSWAMDYPIVSVRVLGLLLVAMKYHFGLDDMQEYKLRNALNLVKDEKSGLQFDFIEWIRLSKLRLDYLISSDFTIREQFRRFRHAGTPPVTLESINEVRKIAEQKRFVPYHSTEYFEQLGKKIKPLEKEKFSSKRTNLQKLRILEEKTNIFLEENKKVPEDVVSTKLKMLIDMKYHKMNSYEEIYRGYEGEEDLSGNLVKVADPINANIMRGCPTVPSNGVPQVDITETLDSGCSKVVKKYWFSPLSMYAGKDCEEDYWGFLQILPDNYLWVLNYFSCYALVPLHKLETEVRQLELYIRSLDKSFFGLEQKLSETPKNESESENAKPTPQYCGCEKCEEINVKYPKQSGKIT